MPTLLSGLDSQVKNVARHSDAGALHAPSPFRIVRGTVDRSLASFRDCSRVMRDIVLGVLCGGTVGLFVAMVGDSF